MICAEKSVNRSAAANTGIRSRCRAERYCIIGNQAYKTMWLIGTCWLFYKLKNRKNVFSCHHSLIEADADRCPCPGTFRRRSPSQAVPASLAGSRCGRENIQKKMTASDKKNTRGQRRFREEVSRALLEIEQPQHLSCSPPPSGAPRRDDVPVVCRRGRCLHQAVRDREAEPSGVCLCVCGERGSGGIRSGAPLRGAAHSALRRPRHLCAGALVSGRARHAHQTNNYLKTLVERSCPADTLGSVRPRHHTRRHGGGQVCEREHHAPALCMPIMSQIARLIQHE